MTTAPDISRAVAVAVWRSMPAGMNSTTNAASRTPKPFSEMGTIPASQTSGTSTRKVTNPTSVPSALPSRYVETIDVSWKSSECAITSASRAGELNRFEAPRNRTSLVVSAGAHRRPMPSTTRSYGE